MLANKKTQGNKFREAVIENNPLQIPGVINAYCAMMASSLGFKALYLSGGGVANNSYGLADVGITNLSEVLIDAKRITDVTDTPLLVDIDTGFGGPLNINRTIKEMIKAGVAAVHIEDQVEAKKCGHLDDKKLVSKQEMVDRIKSCVDARYDESFVIMARTDAYAVEGLEKTIDRALAYQEAGADMLFLEALPDIKFYTECKKHLQVPILANMTEFGKTELYTAKELALVGVSMVLYPRTIDRVMSQAAIDTMKTLLDEGCQKNCIDKMQTRDQLYKFLNYEINK